MTFALTAALILTLAGFLVLLDRRDRRDRAERASWLQRIQNPQAAVAEHHAQAVPPVPEGSALPMSDAEMAEMEGSVLPEGFAAMVARMEAAANGTVQLEDGLIP